MRSTELMAKCKCGFVHTDFTNIKFVRDRINRPKSYCTRCNRRIFVYRYAIESGSGKKLLVR